MKIRLSLWLLLLGLVLGGCKATQPRLPANVEFTVLQLNDVYEIAPLEGGRAGGLARVATVKRELLRENPNTIAVIAGDFLSPSFIGTLRNDDGERIAGQQMVETLNAMGLDYATFGNHEFDLRDAETLKKRMDQSRFRYVSCNARRLVDGQPRPFTQRVGDAELEVPPYVIHEFRNADGVAVRVAIIGVVLPFNRADYVDYLPVTDAFSQAYRQARNEADVVLALTHLAVDQDMELAETVPGVLLFMGGHDHNHMNHYVERTIITKADANAKTVYIHRVTYNPASRMSNVRSTLRRIDDRIPEDPATRAVVERWQSRVTGIMENMGYAPNRVVLNTDDPLICTEVLIRSTPTNYGRLTTRAFESVWPGADVYLLNSGSMRLDDNLSGAVTEYDVLRTFPYGGDIVRTELPGAVLEEVLRTGLLTNRGEGGYFQLANATLDDNGRGFVGGQPIEAARRYRVVLPRFVAEGREQNLPQLANYPFEERETFTVDGQTVRNDVRDIVVYFMRRM